MRYCRRHFAWILSYFVCSANLPAFPQHSYHLDIPSFSNSIYPSNKLLVLVQTVFHTVLYFTEQLTVTP